MSTVNIGNSSVDVNEPSSFKVKKQQQTLLCFLLQPSGFPVNNSLSLPPPSHKVPGGGGEADSCRPQSFTTCYLIAPYFKVLQQPSFTGYSFPSLL